LPRSGCSSRPTAPAALRRPPTRSSRASSTGPGSTAIATRASASSWCCPRCPTCPTLSPCLRASTRACAGRQARQAASGRSRAIRWWCRRQTGRRSRSRLLGATGSRLVLTRWRRTTSAAGSRRANRTPETRIQTRRFGAACERALWSSAHAASATNTGSYGACRVGQWPEHRLVLIR